MSPEHPAWLVVLAILSATVGTPLAIGGLWWCVARLRGLL